MSSRKVPKMSPLNQDKVFAGQSAPTFRTHRGAKFSGTQIGRSEPRRFAFFVRDLEGLVDGVRVGGFVGFGVGGFVGFNVGWWVGFGVGGWVGFGVGDFIGTVAGSVLGSPCAAATASNANVAAVERPRIMVVGKL